MLLSACKKENSSANVASAVTTSSYLPLTSGTYWVYVNAVNGAANDTITTKLTGGTTSINNRIYYIAVNTSKKASSTIYYFNTNHIYGFRGVDATQGISLELQFLNDTVATGHTWTTKVTDNGSINGVPAKMIGTVKEKGIIRVVGGKTFTDVVHTSVELQYDLGNGFEDVSVYDYYLAKGVGMIESDTQIFGTAFSNTTIRAYSIK